MKCKVIRESYNSLIWSMATHTVVIVFVISKFLKRHSKAKCRAPAYSRALHQIRRVVRRIVH